ncbi:TIGR01777 family oxidoreductase [bacterium]|nr:TIGR01777 family oxidoreductase [bacterium]
MKILIGGSSGFIGSRLVAHLRAAGHAVVRLKRAPASPGDPSVVWQPEAGKLDPRELAGIDAVINLSGENLMSGRWTPERKAAIRDSRVLSTRLLADTITSIPEPPRVMINASAIGIYGNRGPEPLDESSPPGTGFLAGVCGQWEAATEPAERAGVRVARVRFGIVLDPEGGALARMLPLFRSGIGGPIGSGHQYVSWITLDDAVAAIEFILMHENLAGPINLVAPNPIMQTEFARELARAVHRPAVVHTPAWAVKLAMGEMADETLLASARVFPRVLLASGFNFRDPDLESGFEHLFHRPQPQEGEAIDHMIH